jgi:hypothetical protein
MVERNHEITMRDIMLFEEHHNLKLPGQYASFLLAFNGGYPEKSTFRISISVGSGPVNVFYGIGTGKMSLERIFEMLVDEFPRRSDIYWR